jgi:hypothetical protein
MSLISTGKQDTIPQAAYLVKHEVKVHVHIVIRKGISTLNVLLSLVQSHVRLFFVEITGVLFVLTRVT